MKPKNIDPDALTHHFSQPMDKDDAEKPKPQQVAPPVNAAREARLAQALRVNLRRRKQGAAGRSPSDD